MKNRMTKSAAASVKLGAPSKVVALLGLLSLASGCAAVAEPRACEEAESSEVIRVDRAYGDRIWDACGATYQVVEDVTWRELRISGQATVQVAPGVRITLEGGGPFQVAPGTVFEGLSEEEGEGQGWGGVHLECGAEAPSLSLAGVTVRGAGALDGSGASVVLEGCPEGTHLRGLRIDRSLGTALRIHGGAPRVEELSVNGFRGSGVELIGPVAGIREMLLLSAGGEEADSYIRIVPGEDSAEVGGAFFHVTGVPNLDGGSEGSVEAAIRIEGEAEPLIQAVAFEGFHQPIAGSIRESFGTPSRRYPPAYDPLRSVRFGLWGLPRSGPPLLEGCSLASEDVWVCCDSLPASTCLAMGTEAGASSAPRLLRTAANCFDERAVFRAEEAALGCPVASQVVVDENPRACLFAASEATPSYLGAVLPWGLPEAYDWCRRTPEEL